MKVLLTCPPMAKRIEEFRKGFEIKGLELVIPDLVQSMSEEQLVAILPEVDAWIIGDDPATERVLAAGRKGRLKAAVKWGVGVDNVDFEAAQKLGLPVSNTPRMFGNEVADLGINYLLGLARQSYWIDREVRKGNWIKPAGLSVSGKTIGIIGLGDIGLACARRLKGFDVHIIGYDPFAKITPLEAGIDEIVRFPLRLDEIDFLLITCSLTPSSFHLINIDTIALMKNGVYIVNVSRGKLIDEHALVSALKSGKIRGAALDVFEEEPLPLDDLLREFDQCIFGTHNGSNTVEAVRRASHKAMDILFEYLKV